MTKEQVQAAYPNARDPGPSDVASDPYTRLVLDDVVIAGHTFRATFPFKGNEGLATVILSPDPPLITEKAGYLATEIVELLTEKYGRPVDSLDASSGATLFKGWDFRGGKTDVHLSVIGGDGKTAVLQLTYSRDTQRSLDNL